MKNNGLASRSSRSADNQRVLALDLIEIFLVLILVIPWLWVLYDALRWDDASWQMARRNKLMMVLFILLLPPFGVLTYLILTRPELVAANTPPTDPANDGAPAPQGEVNPLLLMRRNTVVAIGLLLAAIAIAGILGVLRLWRLA